jgi:hypothetical protein
METGWLELWTGRPEHSYVAKGVSSGLQTAGVSQSVADQAGDATKETLSAAAILGGASEAVKPPRKPLPGTALRDAPRLEAPARLTWQELSAADRQLLNDVLQGRQPHSALGRLSPQQLEAALDYYQATGAAGRGTLPSELVRDFNQARVDFLRTGSGQPPAGVYDYAEGRLQRQSPEWLEANRDAVNSLRQAIERMRQRGGGG